MKTIIKLEEAGLFLLSIFLFLQLDFAWWLFPVLLFLPDLSMLGYLIDTKSGAFFYNIIHHRGIISLIIIIGILLGNTVVQLAGIIMFAHSTLDRALGYGLKFDDSFNNTHLGKIKEQAI